MKKRIFTLALIVSVITNAFSQFVAPIETLPLNRPIEITLVDGKVIGGKLKGGMFNSGKIAHLNVLDTVTDTKTKYKAVEIKSAKMKPGKLAKFAASLDNSSNLNKLDNLDDIAKREWIYFETVQMGKKDKSFLMQRLNPGATDAKIRVFLDPNAQETASAGIGGMTLVGGEDKSYFITKGDGTKSLLVIKKKYKEQFTELFSDCAAFGEKFKEYGGWLNFPTHVDTYNELCK